MSYITSQYRGYKIKMKVRNLLRLPIGYSVVRALLLLPFIDLRRIVSRTSCMLL